MARGIYKSQRNKARLRFWKKYKGPMVCYHCNKPVARGMVDGDPHLATVDHLVPLSKGGKSNFTNLVLSCYTCNQLRSKK